MSGCFALLSHLQELHSTEEGKTFLLGEMLEGAVKGGLEWGVYILVLCKAQKLPFSKIRIISLMSII